MVLRKAVQEIICFIRTTGKKARGPGRVGARLASFYIPLSTTYNSAEVCLMEAAGLEAPPHGENQEKKEFL